MIWNTQKSVEFNIDLNATDDYGYTAFKTVCCMGHANIAQMLIQKSVEFKIDMNAKDDYGYTAFLRAC